MTSTSEIVHVKGDGFAFDIELDTSLQAHAYIKASLDKGKFYEPETEFVAEQLDADDAFIDIGAHIGWYSLLAAQKKIPVTSFEPDLDNFDRLMRNIDLNEFANIRPIDQAMSDTDGHAVLHINQDADGGHALWDMSDHPGCQKTRETGVKKQGVQTMTLDTFLKNSPPFFSNRLWIKVDAEGYEYKILSKFPFEKYKGRDVVVIAEINRYALAQCGSSEDQLRGLFYNQGWRSYVMAGDKLEPVYADSFIHAKAVFNMIFSSGTEWVR